jgi:hypothetical protein
MSKHYLNLRNLVHLTYAVGDEGFESKPCREMAQQAKMILNWEQDAMRGRQYGYSRRCLHLANDAAFNLLSGASSTRVAAYDMGLAYRQLRRVFLGHQERG